MVEDAAAAMVEKLSWLMESWSSIEVHIRIDTRNRSGTGGRSQETYIETGLGQRLYDRTMPVAGSDETVRWVNYADGRRFAEANWEGPRQVHVHYTKQFEAGEGTTPSSWRPEPLRFLYLYQEPLAKVLTRADALGREQRLGRDCEVLVLRGVKWTYSPVDIVYALDCETGLPLEVRCYDAGADRERDQPQWYWEAKSFDRVEQGRYWPLRSADYVYAPREGVGKELLTTRDILVESIHFDKEYPESVFRPVFEPGAHILDAATGKTSVVPGQPVAPARSASSAPVQAMPPADWTSTLSTAGLVLGIALLTVGGVAWWRQRRG